MSPAPRDPDAPPAPVPVTTPPGPEHGPRVDAIALTLVVLVAMLLLGLLARVVQLQVEPPAALAAFRSERTSTVPEPGRRGDLLDRRGRIVAASHFGYRVFVDPTALRDPPDADFVALANALGLPPEQVGQPITEKRTENQRRHDAWLARRQGNAADPPVVAAPASGPAADDAAAQAPPAPTDAPPAPADAPPATDDDRGPSLVRYVPIGAVLDDAQVENVRRLRIPGVHLELRPVRVVPGAELLAPLLGLVGAENRGLMGAEKVFNDRVEPEPGRMEYVRDARGRPLWVSPGGYQPAQRGEDVRLSIDLQIQAIALEELRRGVEEADAAGGRVIVMDPATGEVLAIADLVRELTDVVDYDWTHLIAKDNQAGGPRYRTIRQDPRAALDPALARNRCVEDVYEPGSTFKPFMWSAVTELGLARPDEVFNTAGGRWTTPYGRSLSDVTRRDQQTWAEVLINSSNIGMAQGVARLSFPQARAAILKFGFGRKTGTGLPGESPGLVTSARAWSKYTQTSVAMGHEVAVTPVQMTRAFCVFARDGDDAGTLPPIRFAAVRPEDEPLVRVMTRVLPAGVARLTRETLRGVTANLDKKLAQRPEPEVGWRYELFGKSGTAEIPLGEPPPGKRRPRGSDGYFNGQYNSSFIAGGPVVTPRLVCLAVIDDPGPDMVRRKEHRGSAVAGPVVRRIMERSLSYLGVPASHPPTTVEQALSGQAPGLPAAATPRD